MAASPIIWVHLVAALAAVVLGARQLFGRKGDGRHRALGWLWVVAMLVTAISSFGVGTSATAPLFGLSWIHALSVVSLVSLAMALRAARAGRNDAHAGWMIGGYAGLVIAGVFTLAPGRLLGGWVVGW